MTVGLYLYGIFPEPVPDGLVLQGIDNEPVHSEMIDGFSFLYSAAQLALRFFGIISGNYKRLWSLILS